VSETVVACLTPAGTGAIAVLAVRGPQALDVVALLFLASGGRQPPVVSARTGFADHGGLTPPARQERCFYLGKFGEEAKDDVVLVVKQVEPVPWVELHCHGGREVVKLLIETLQRHGVREITWSEFLIRSESSTLRGAALAQLAQARTVRTAAILLDQYHGAFERELAEVLAALDRDDINTAGRLLSLLAQRAPVGRRLTAPWRVVVAGAPNVGKSSLINALVGYQRSVVSATPGTTRDLVSVETAFDGWPVELVDTAGLRDDAGSLEEQGVGLAREAAAAADLCLWVLDGSGTPVWPEARPANLQVVVNKVDLGSAWEGEEALPRVSALTGQGVPELCQAIGRWLVPYPPPPGSGVPFTAELCDRIMEAGDCLDAGMPARARAMLRTISG